MPSNRSDTTAADRLRAELADTLNALGGDRLALSSSDVAALLAERDRYRTALGAIASPSWAPISTLRTLARDALKETP